MKAAAQWPLYAEGSYFLDAPIFEGRMNELQKTVRDLHRSINKFKDYRQKEILNRNARTSGRRSPGRLNFVRCRLLFVGPQYVTCFVSPLWTLKIQAFWDIAPGHNAATTTINI